MLYMSVLRITLGALHQSWSFVGFHVPSTSPPQHFTKFGHWA